MINQLKKIAGMVWIALGPTAAFFLVRTALSEIAAKPTMDTKIQWGIFIVVFIPICIGLIFFGWFALKGEYTVLPESSEEI